MPEITTAFYASGFPKFPDSPSQLLDFEYLVQFWEKVGNGLGLRDVNPAQLAGTFDGRARLWYSGFPSPPGSYEQFAKALKHFPSYTSSDGSFHQDLARNLLHRFRWLKQDRSVDEYARSYQNAARNTFCKQDVDSEFNRLWFIHGLDPEIRDVLLNGNALPPTFDAVVLLAKCVEGTCGLSKTALEHWPTRHAGLESAAAASVGVQPETGILEERMRDLRASLQRSEKLASDLEHTVQNRSKDVDERMAETEKVVLEMLEAIEAYREEAEERAAASAKILQALHTFHETSIEQAEQRATEAKQSSLDLNKLIKGSFGQADKRAATTEHTLQDISESLKKLVLLFEYSQLKNSTPGKLPKEEGEDCGARDDALADAPHAPQGDKQQSENTVFKPRAEAYIDFEGKSRPTLS